MYDQEGRTNLRKPAVRVFERNRSWTIVGDEGDLYRDPRNVELRRNVVVISSEGMRLETSVLRWDADEQRLWTDAPVTITRDGSVVHGTGQDACRMEVYFDAKGDRILRTVSTGGVRIITRDCRTATAKRAEYSDLDQRVVLIGGARVWQEDNVVSGETITFFLAQDRAVA